MDAVSLTLNILALTLSLAALAISAALAFRQLKTMQQSNLLPVVADFFQEFERKGLLQDLDYVIHEVYPKYSPSLGYSGLPDPARAHMTSLSNFYESLGVLVAHRVIDESVAISAFGTQSDRAWRLLEPFILREGELRGASRFQAYFEDFVWRVRKTPPPVVERRMGLKRISSSHDDSHLSNADLAASWLKSAVHWHQGVVGNHVIDADTGTMNK
jgi:hypothetical protein